MTVLQDSSIYKPRLMGSQYIDLQKRLRNAALSFQYLFDHAYLYETSMPTLTSKSTGRDWKGRTHTAC